MYVVRMRVCAHVSACMCTCVWQQEVGEWRLAAFLLAFLDDGGEK